MVEPKTDQTNNSDEKVMKRFASMRRVADYELIYQRYFNLITSYLKWLSGDKELSKDIAQNIFIKVFERPDLFDDKLNFKVWIFALAQNQWKNELRRLSNQAKHVKLAMPSNGRSSEEVANETENQLKEKLRSHFTKLSESHQEVVTLKYSSNLTIKEIAEVLACSEGTVKSRLFYALKHLHKLVNPQS